MIIYVEVLFLIIIVFLFIGWTLWKFITDKTLRKKYKPENDEGRKAEERRRALVQREKARGTSEEFRNPTTVVSGPPKPEKPRVLEATTSKPDGKTGRSPGKVGKILKFFNRRRKVDGKKEGI